MPATTSRLVEIQPVIRSTFLPSYSDISIIIPQLYGVIQWLENLLVAWSFLLRRNCMDIWPLSPSWPHKHAGLYFSAFHQTDMRDLYPCRFLLTVFLTVLRVCFPHMAYLLSLTVRIVKSRSESLLFSYKHISMFLDSWGRGYTHLPVSSGRKYTVLRILIQKPISLQKMRKLLWGKQLEVTLLLKRFPASKGTQHFQMTE